MSLALDFAPCAPVPSRTRPATPVQVATVSVLRPPADAASPGLRLTRRGVGVLAVLLAAVGAALVWVAWLSAPAAPAARPADSAGVTVQPGDTLWGIAARVAPNADPMGEVELLRKLNHLPNVDLVPGQRLRVR